VNCSIPIALLFEGLSAIASYKLQKPPLSYVSVLLAALSLLASVLFFPYLGFLHATAYSKPSLVCDFLELYRYLAEDFLILFCQDLKVGDFVMKGEWASGKKDRRGKREYLSDTKTGEMLKLLNRYLEGMVELPRIRIGKRQTIETLINEEALLLAKFLRNERKTWTPRTAVARSAPD